MGGLVRRPFPSLCLAKRIQDSVAIYILLGKSESVTHL